MEYPKFKVCVRCFTFNHSKYITNAMNGFVMQQTDFPYVCCIVDDASTDGEQEVIRKYVSDNFDLSEGSCHFERETDYAFITYAQHKTNKNCYFAVLYLKKNHYSIKKPKKPYLAEWQDGCEYYALCEGDDYWIKPYKLKKQVDILDNNGTLSSCWSGYDSYKGRDLVCVNIYPQKVKGEYSIFTIEDWTDKWFTKTLTSLFRHTALSEYSAVMKNFNYARDIHLCYYLLKWGPAAYIHESMGIYNIHEGGICSMVENNQNAIHSYNCYKELYVKEHNEVLRKHLLSAIIRRIAFPQKGFSRYELFKEGTHVCKSPVEFLRLLYHFVVSK